MYETCLLLPSSQLAEGLGKSAIKSLEIACITVYLQRISEAYVE